MTVERGLINISWWCPPKLTLGKAMNYADKQWPEAYRLDGPLHIDSNLFVNLIRPFNIGRKNFLLCDSVAGAKASAHLYSPIETVKTNGTEPSLYLRRAFAEPPKANSLEYIDALLPLKKKPAYDEFS